MIFKIFQVLVFQMIMAAESLSKALQDEANLVESLLLQSL